MFQLLFERSADAIWLFDPQAGVFVDCNQAAVELMHAGTKEKLLRMRPEDLSHGDAGVGAQHLFDPREIGHIVKVGNDDLDRTDGDFGEPRRQRIETFSVAGDENQITTTAR